MIKIFSHPLAIVVFTLIGAAFSYSLYSSSQKTRISTEQVAVLEQEITEMTSEVSELEQQVEAAQTPEMKEKIIRDQLLMQKDGEIVVQIPDIPESSYKRLTPQPSFEPWDEWEALLF
jgi:cell division protein FtsB